MKQKTGFFFVAFFISGVSLLSVLGVWQVQRLSWKTALIATIEQKSNAAPLKSFPAEEAWQDAEYRKLEITGQFLNNHAFPVGPRTEKGRNGFHLFVPFQTAAGETIMVNRGWIPEGRNIFLHEEKGKITVWGVVRFPARGALTPDNDPDQNRWYWPDVLAMAEKAELSDIAPAYLVMTEKKEGAYPQGLDVRANLRNNHLQYAVFWFTMAFVFAGVFFFRMRRG